MKYIISFATRVIPRKHLQIISLFFSRVISIFYIGNKVECPVCGKHYRKFLPYGRKVSRPNALCPNCLSLERHRAIWLYLKQSTKFFSDNLKVLHIAPEICFLKRFEKLPNLDYITADLESPWAKVKLNVKDIPFEDNTFDFIMCNHLLEHIDDEQLALSELYRVMKPNGKGIFQVPININRKETYEDPSIVSEKDREKHFGQKDHVREYGLDYPDRLRKGGFNVQDEGWEGLLSQEEARKYGLIIEEKIYCVSK